MIIIIQLVVLTLSFEERLDVSEKLAAACFLLMAFYEIHNLILVIYCLPDLTKLANFLKAVKQTCPDWGA